MNDTLTQVALHKVIKDPTYKQLVPILDPGEYPVRFQVEILGTLKKGKPFTQRVAARANPWAIAAYALSRLNGVSIESVVRDSLAISKEEEAAIKEKATVALQRLIDATECTMDGRVTANLVHREV